MELIISIILLIVFAGISYWILENYDFKLALIAGFGIMCIRAFITNGFGNIFFVIFLAFIMGFLDTVIKSFIYNKTASFWSYLIIYVLIIIGLILAFSFIMTLLTPRILS